MTMAPRTVPQGHGAPSHPVHAGSRRLLGACAASWGAATPRAHRSSADIPRSVSPASRTARSYAASCSRISPVIRFLIRLASSSAAGGAGQRGERSAVCVRAPAAVPRTPEKSRGSRMAVGLIAVARPDYSGASGRSPFVGHVGRVPGRGSRRCSSRTPRIRAAASALTVAWSVASMMWVSIKSRNAVRLCGVGAMAMPPRNHQLGRGRYGRRCSRAGGFR